MVIVATQQGSGTTSFSQTFGPFARPSGVASSSITISSLPTGVIQFQVSAFPPDINGVRQAALADSAMLLTVSAATTVSATLSMASMVDHFQIVNAGTVATSANLAAGANLILTAIAVDASGEVVMVAADSPLAWTSSSAALTVAATNAGSSATITAANGAASGAVTISVADPTSGKSAAFSVAVAAAPQYQVSFLFEVVSGGKAEKTRKPSPKTSTRHIQNAKGRMVRDAGGGVTGTIAAGYSQVNDRGEIVWYTLTESFEDSASVYLRTASGDDTLIITIPSFDSGTGVTFALNNISQVAITNNDFIGQTTTVSVWNEGVLSPVAALTGGDWYALAFSDSGYMLLENSSLSNLQTLLLAPDGSQIDPGISVQLSSQATNAEIEGNYYTMDQALDIIGYTENGGSEVASIRTRAGQTTLLTLPSNAGANPALYTTGLNDTGSAFGLVVGYGDSYVSADQKYVCSVRWSAPNYAPALLQPLSYVDLGGPTSYQAFANGINNAGIVVGSSGNTIAYATLWPAGSNAPTDINSLIPPDSGWDLHDAVGINNVGQIIGNGFYNGQWAAFLLTPTAGAQS